jgi:uncharacterized protein YxeA
MKTIIKTAACLLFVGIGTAIFAQTSTNSSQKSPEKKKQTAKKGSTTKAADNKIAVSDQIQTSDKSGKKQPTKGVSNK